MIILDTNVVSALMRDPAEQRVLDWLDRQPGPSVWTTTITVLECRFGIMRLAAGRRRVSLDEAFTRLVTDDLAGRILPFDQAGAEQTASLMVRRAEQGRASELRDMMIAGIAVSRRATLVTRNIRHFEHSGLDLVDPWTDATAQKGK